jgi:WD40 repeat protein
MSVVYSPYGGLFASSGLDGTIRPWQLSTLTEIANLKYGPNTGGLAFNPDGSLLASKSENGTLRLWGAE